jgi:hypothetical protein
MRFPSKSRQPGRRSRAGAIAGFLLGGALWWGTAGLAAAASEGAANEYDVKAMLLYNFTQFIEWPANFFSAPDSPLVIGVLGRDPFGGAIDQLVGQTPLGKHGIVIRRLRSIDAASECHLLFISPSEKDNLQQILLALRDRPVLTIADFDGFARRGGMIELFKSPDSKVRLRINLEAAKKNSLAISAKLLRVAEVVGVREE